MGTPDFAVGSLNRLLESGFEVVGVITAPDRPSGRGRKINESAVKKFAKSKDLTVLQPTNLKDGDFLQTLEDLRADLQVVVAFRMLPQVVWGMPKYGTFNLHASLLPQYRGAAPINWAIINGETETGVTTFFIDDKIDTGSIIQQKSALIYPEDNAGDLHDRLMELGAELVVDTCKQIENGTAVSHPQEDAEEIKTAHKIHKETCRIDWSASAQDIHNHIRGLSPYPAAWTYLVNGDEEISLKIFKSEVESVEHQEETGKIVVEKRMLKVAITEGYLQLLEVQFPGKRRMSIVDALNGINLDKSAHVR